MEQLAARRAHNPEVVGSSPTPATKETVEAVALAVFLLPEKNWKKLEMFTKSSDQGAESLFPLVNFPQLSTVYIPIDIPFFEIKGCNGLS